MLQTVNTYELSEKLLYEPVNLMLRVLSACLLFCLEMTSAIRHRMMTSSWATFYLGLRRQENLRFFEYTGTSPYYLLFLCNLFTSNNL